MKGNYQYKRLESDNDLSFRSCEKHKKRHFHIKSPLKTPVLSRYSKSVASALRQGMHSSVKVKVGKDNRISAVRSCASWDPPPVASIWIQRDHDHPDILRSNSNISSITNVSYSNRSIRSGRSRSRSLGNRSSNRSQSSISIRSERDSLGENDKNNENLTIPRSNANTDAGADANPNAILGGTTIRGTVQYAGENVFVTTTTTDTTPKNKNIHAANRSIYRSLSLPAPKISGSFSQRAREQERVLSRDCSFMSYAEEFRVTILVMDPDTSKYEFILCYFDYHTSLVKDILNSITQSATYESLRKKTYLGLCRPDTGEELINFFMVKEYNIGKDEILVAIPQGYTRDQCITYSKALLKHNEDEFIKMTQQSDDKSSQSVSKQQQQQQQQPQHLSSQKSQLSTITFMETVDAFTYPSLFQNIRLSLYLFLTCLICYQLFQTSKQIHERVSRPIHAGDELNIGEWRNKCGILSVFPESWTGCHSISLKIERSSFEKEHNDNNVRLTLFDDKDQTIIWKLEGSNSGTKEETKQLKQRNKKFNNPHKKDVWVDFKGQVMIQGKIGKVTTMSKKGIYYIIPWPFEVIPPSMKQSMNIRTKKTWIPLEDDVYVKEWYRMYNSLTF